ncbi:MAG TPA: DHA2 family efflux MFS transporter permease subunit [Candidatus Sulfotelmatobacter sp.]|nr:DHA2 family efflux MFS transporter permease subunit [Candidatus Sulfotelmatobacter sp.]
MSTLAPSETLSATDFTRPGVNPWFIAFTVMLATFMEVLDTSIANVALPHIAGSLSAGVDESTWVLTSYLVSNAIVLPLTGWFSRLFGRKTFYMSCVMIFIVSSFLCGMATSLPLLVLFRVLQGAGGGGLQPVSQAILVESFPRKKQGMAMAVYGMGVVVAPIVGPTLGGWLTDNYSWRWIFFINIPVGLLSIFLTSTLIHDPPHVARSENGEGVRIDYIGLGLLAVGLGFLQVVLDKGQRDDWFGSNFIVWCSVVCAVGLIGAVLWELRQKDPVVELHLFKNRNYATATFLMFLLGVVLYGSTVLLPVMLQTLAGYTAQLSGLVLSPGAIVTLVSLPLVGWLLARFQARWLVIFGLTVLSVGMFQLAYINLTTGFWTYVYLWMISRGGLAFLFVPINVTAFSFISKEKMNNATGLINLARNIGGSVGISMVTTIQARLTQKHQNDLIGHVSPLNPRYLAALHGLAADLQEKGSSASTAMHQAGALLYGEVQRQAAMLAFIDVFWLLGVVCLCMIPFMFLIKRPPTHHEGETLPSH